jgi:putative iron-dependent peroxidase
MTSTSREQPRPQPAIFRPPPKVGTVLVLDLDPGVDPGPGLTAIREASRASEGELLVGLGAPLVLALGAEVAGLRGFPALSGMGVAFPSTQGAVWLLLGGDERGEVLDRAMDLHGELGDGWRLLEEVDTFRYRGGRDLTGYEDGTENPKDAAAVAAAVIAEGAPGVRGGSFVAVQRYVHDLVRFRGFDAPARDAIIGRHHETNEELAEAAATAHVKRSAQESFAPPAFMLRRSMPWGGVREHGLYFVAFVEALDRFERVLRRMAGLDDGQLDALLGISRALSGGYYFCPPLADDGGLDLRAVLG